MSLKATSVSSHFDIKNKNAIKGGTITYHITHYIQALTLRIFLACSEENPLIT